MAEHLDADESKSRDELEAELARNKKELAKHGLYFNSGGTLCFGIYRLVKELKKAGHQPNPKRMVEKKVDPQPQDSDDEWAEFKQERKRQRRQ